MRAGGGGGAEGAPVRSESCASTLDRRTVGIAACGCGSRRLPTRRRGPGARRASVVRHVARGGGARKLRAEGQCPRHPRQRLEGAGLRELPLAQPRLGPEPALEAWRARLWQRRQGRGCRRWLQRQIGGRGPRGPRANHLGRAVVEGTAQEGGKQTFAQRVGGGEDGHEEEVLQRVAAGAGPGGRRAAAAASREGGDDRVGGQLHHQGHLAGPGRPCGVV
mmetsp:Transcript_35891/g.116233  ORF Transcript_35891/g.116233 Transcript_35891/m.116233 type:complete len:220 (+) Transcript_35891:597-1256(+)